MWLIFYKYYNLIFYKQLKYKQYSLIHWQINWFFMNVKKKSLRLFPIFMLQSVFECFNIQKKKSWYFFSVDNFFFFIKFFIHKIPLNFQQLIQSKSCYKNQFLSLDLNNFFQINKLPKLLFFLSTFKRLKIFWIIQKALLVK